MMEGATLRINTYSTQPPAATVNCARMISVNHHSTRGVVHSIDKVLQPVTKSLAELITSDPQFSILYQRECCLLDFVGALSCGLFYIYLFYVCP